MKLVWNDDAVVILRTGTLPVEWAALTSLVHIDMSYNLLTGGNWLPWVTLLVSEVMLAPGFLQKYWNVLQDNFQQPGEI